MRRRKNRAEAKEDRRIKKYGGSRASDGEGRGRAEKIAMLCEPTSEQIRRTLYRMGGVLLLSLCLILIGALADELRAMNVSLVVQSR